MRKRARLQVYGWVVAGVFLAGLGFTPQALAIVGQAERYDPFKQEDLDIFQQNLMNEEKQRSGSSQMQKNFQDLAAAQREGEADGTGTDQELQDFQRELLTLPKRDRVRFEAQGAHTYDSNVIRAVPRQEKDDSFFDTQGATLFDLSGKKTDLRFEVNGGKHWSVEFPEGDTWTAGERVRYRRRYFKKIQHSWQSAISRNSSKSVEINAQKVRWDSSQNSTYNYPLTKKFSINLDTNSNMRTFTQEAFDQDSSWEATAAPAVFFSATPKTRFSLGYNIGTNHIRTKSGDSNTHEIHAGYFGKITRKSSASIDLSYSHQTPKSLDTATTNTYTAGVGYIWQMTGKSQLTMQVIRSVQNTSSDLVSGSLDGDGGEIVTVKNDSHITNESFSMSLNSRLSSKLTATGTMNFTHSNTSVLKDGNKENESTQYNFPTSLGFSYFLKRWATISFQYTFTYRTGYEKSDRYRDHLLVSTLRLSI